MYCVSIFLLPCTNIHELILFHYQYQYPNRCRNGGVVQFAGECNARDRVSLVMLIPPVPQVTGILGIKGVSTTEPCSDSTANLLSSRQRIGV